MGKEPGDTHRKAKPTAADKAAAERLWAEWQARKMDRGLTQDIMATKLGGTQGLVSQYLHGKIPLNFRALLLFCDALGIEPARIRTDLPEQSLSGSDAPPSASHSARPDFTKIAGTVYVLTEYLEITGGPSEWVADRVLLEIAYALVDEFGEAITPSNVIVLAKRLGQRLRAEGGKGETGTIEGTGAATGKAHRRTAGGKR